MVTVEEAIKKGRVQLFWIPLSMMFGSIILMMFAVSFVPDGTMWVPICGFGGFLLMIVAPFLWYFRMLPRWRIWAFSNVRNVHELKQRAVLCRIYPEDNSFFWRFEMKSAVQADAINDLEQRFQQPDVFEEDYTIPYETTYSYSKADKWGFIILVLICLGSTFFTFDPHQMFITIIPLCGSVVFGILAYKRFKSTEPQLIISNDGITTQKNGFHPWSEIENEQVFYVSAGKSSYYGLSYEVNGEKFTMSLKELTGLSSYKVDHVLRTYRGRFQGHRQRV